MQNTAKYDSSPNTRQPHEPRPRINQPMGFSVSKLMHPDYYYGRRHDYVYYPESWVDSNTGRSYEKGYYDENGKYYDSVSFQKNGKYENVLCRCDYCGTDTVLTLDNSSGTSLQCPSCGAPMRIVSELDEERSRSSGNTHVYSSEESLKKQKRKMHTVRNVLIAVLLLIAIETSYTRQQVKKWQREYIETPYQQLTLAQNNDPVYLVRSGDNSYGVSAQGASWDKCLLCDSGEDSYYDAESQCWLWYNTDVEPALWQYWYEGISSNYGDYGWMEHNSEGWWIEESEGNWIKLPEEYDTGALWYIE